MGWCQISCVAFQTHCQAVVEVGATASMEAISRGGANRGKPATFGTLIVSGELHDTYLWEGWEGGKWQPSSHGLSFLRGWGVFSSSCC